MQYGMAAWGTDRQPPIDEQARCWAVRHLRNRLTFGRDDVARNLADLIANTALAGTGAFVAFPGPFARWPGRDCEGRIGHKGGEGPARVAKGQQGLPNGSKVAKGSKGAAIRRPCSGGSPFSADHPRLGCCNDFKDPTKAAAPSCTLSGRLPIVISVLNFT